MVSQELPVKCEPKVAVESIGSTRRELSYSAALDIVFEITGAVTVNVLYQLPRKT